MPIKAITFDLWNTLLSEGNYIDLRINYLHDALEDLGFPRDLEEIKNAYRSAHDYAHKVWAEENYRYVPAEERVEYMLKRLRINLPDSVKEPIVKWFKETILRRPPSLIEGVKETITTLHGRFRLGIICDTGMTPGYVMRIVLRRAGILGFFDSTVFSDEVGFNKPHRLVFKRALMELGVMPSEAVHVGDLLHTDIAGAKMIGMRAVWIRREAVMGYEAIRYKPDYEIEELAEIIDVLRRIQS